MNEETTITQEIATNHEREMIVRLDSLNKEYTTEGYLKFYDVPVARSGFFDYGVNETIHDGALEQGYSRGQILKAYRPATTFTDFVNKSIEGKPITFRHPKEGLAKPDNVKVHGAINGKAYLVRNGQEVELYVSELILYSKEIISAYNDGMRELSIGFYYKKPVEWVINENFHFIEEIIEINHLALVERGRAGSGFRLHNKLEVNHNMDEKLNKVSEQLTSVVAALETSAIQMGEFVRLHKEMAEEKKEEKKEEDCKTNENTESKTDSKKKVKNDDSVEGGEDSRKNDDDDTRNNDMFYSNASAAIQELMKYAPDNVVWGASVGGKEFTWSTDVDVKKLFKKESESRNLSAARMNMFPNAKPIDNSDAGRNNSDTQIKKMASIGD